MNKYFKNVTPTSADYYIYGTIEDVKLDENSVVANEMKQELDELGNIKDLNIYIRWCFYRLQTVICQKCQRRRFADRNEL